MQTQTDVLKKLSKAVQSVRRKVHLLRSGDASMQRELQTFFQPVTKMLEKNETNLLTREYMQKYRDPVFYEKEVDKHYGVQETSPNLWMLGKTKLSFDDHYVTSPTRKFTNTRGLLELLFKNRPQNVSAEDQEAYYALLQDSGILADPPKRSAKYRRLIEEPAKKRRREDMEGSGLWKQDVKTCDVEYKYFDNPNVLVERLLELTASKHAGNTSTGLEIRGIEEALRNAEYIE